MRTVNTGSTIVYSNDMCILKLPYFRDIAQGPMSPLPLPVTLQQPPPSPPGTV